MHHPPNDAPDAPDDASRTDWIAVRAEYVTGQWTNRQLAARHRCSHTQIGRRAAAEGWLRVGEGGASTGASRPAPPAPPAPVVHEPADQAPVTRRLLSRAGAADPGMATTTPTEEAFITEYLRNGMNATAAAVAVLGSQVAVAKATGWQILRRPRVVARINAERQRMAVAHQMTRDQLLGEFLAIVRADPNALTQMRQVACGECWGGERLGRWADPDPECAECEGEGDAMPWIADTRKLSPDARALYAGIKVTANGVQVLMHDKMAALVNVGKILGAFEKDNEQKQPVLTEAIAAFVSQLHTQGAGRLQFTPRQPRPPAPDAPKAGEVLQ